MKLSNLTKLSLSLLLAWGSVAQAEVAGRVLVSVGDNSAVRAGKEIKLTAGTPVETGDTLRVGDASNLQVRFTDEAIMALRPNTTMRIDEYAFTNKADADKSIFSLLKGGLRTITGVIGRNSRNNYAVKAETSTIGIRGTHFNIVHCDNDCRNPDGSAGQNGTFGGVTDGRIAVTNNAGEREFGKSEFFFVASKDALPSGLIAPPPFLRDRLEGQAKTKGKDKAPGSGTGTESTATAGGTTASTQPAVTAAPPVIQTTTTTPYVPGDQPAVTNSVLIPSFAHVGAWAGQGTWSGGYASTSGFQMIFSGQLPVISGYEGTSSANAAGLGLLDLFLNAYTASYSWTDGYDTYQTTFSKGAAVDVGTSTAAGNLTWGRYLSSYTETDSYGTHSGTDWEHFAVGSPVTALPTSGSYLFNWIGGTSPTDHTLAVGTLTSGGSVNVHFGSSSISMQTATPITWSMPNTGATYSVSFSSSTTPTTSSYSSGGTGVEILTFSTISGSTSCTGCSGASSTVRPQFMGSTAQNLGLGIATTASGTSIGNQYMSSTQVYQR